MVIYPILTLLMVIAFGLWVFDVNPLKVLPTKKKQAITQKKRSWAANEVMKAYNNIPASHRPDIDLGYILDALDVKHGIDEVYQHFNDYPRPDWRCTCLRYSPRNAERCPFNEYRVLRKEMEGIAADLKEQEHAIQMAAVADGLSQAEAVVARLKDERKMIQSVTKELTANAE